MRHASFVWLIHMTHSYDSFTCHDSFIYVMTHNAKYSLKCVMPHSYDSFIWLIHMTHSHVTIHSYVSWLIMPNTPWNVSFIWLIHLTHSCNLLVLSGSSMTYMPYSYELIRGIYASIRAYVEYFQLPYIFLIHVTHLWHMCASFIWRMHGIYIYSGVCVESLELSYLYLIHTTHSWHMCLLYMIYSLYLCLCRCLCWTALTAL